MNTTVSVSSSRLFSPPSLFDLSLLRPNSLTLRLRTTLSPSPRSRRFVPVSAKSRNSSSSFIEPQIDAEFDEDDEEFDDEDDDEDDDEGEDIAADEYDDFSGGLSDEEADPLVSVEAAEEDGGKREELKWQRVEKLRGEVREFGEEIIDVDELASIYDFRIDKFQRLAVKAFLNGSSVVVSAPTSSGKTLIAEAAAVATIAKGRRLFYTTPLKALSNQKFRDFREMFGESTVGLLTGDSAVNKEAQVLIMTTEILRNMLYQSVGKDSSGDSLFHVDAIVLDEVHYLSDISRGTVWEEIVIYCPKRVQLICLSATVANPDELAGWIGKIHGKTELVTSSKRPVPLTWHFSTKNSLYPLLDESGARMNRRLSLNYLQQKASGGRYSRDEGRNRNSRRRPRARSYEDSTSDQPLSKNDVNAIRRSQAPQITDTLWQLKSRDMLPAVWFIFSRKGCDAAVQYVEDYTLLDEIESSEVELALKRFRVKYPDAVRQSAVKGLRRGVAAHHAGCLPLWKSFVEELFQRGLVKVVFATETLAAGINMPARTSVIASLSKRTEAGLTLLKSNELLQMAGRAGRRGIDKEGFVVLVQSPYEGAEEGCKILFSGLEPLVSQFTASYGMVLNLLAGGRSARRTGGRTLDEARKLVEQSFGNYLSSNVVIAAQEEVIKIEQEIEVLNSELTDEAIDNKSRRVLSEAAYKEITDLQEELRAEKRKRTELRRRLESQKISSLKPLLDEIDDGQLAYICVQHKDSDGALQTVPAIYLGKADSIEGLKFIDDDDNEEQRKAPSFDFEPSLDKPSYYAALGLDNSWYVSTEKWIKTVYRTWFPNTALSPGDPLPRETMKSLLTKNDELKWEKLSESEFGSVFAAQGSMETWSWSLNVPVLNSLSDEDDLLRASQPYRDAVEAYKEQRTRVARLKKKIARTEGFREYKKVLEAAKLIEDKIKRLRIRSRRLTNRIEQIEPSGWKEFLQISRVIHETRAMDVNGGSIFPLGETAAAIRGENELWLATVLRNNLLVGLKPAELAGVCASLVSEGIKVRPSKSSHNGGFIYEPTEAVMEAVRQLDEQRELMVEVQERHGVEIPCGLDTQFAGMVEAWACGLSWGEIMMDCAMDEGDLARLLRRTIDILAQVPKLPDIDPGLQRVARAASEVMDRPPISELAG